MPGTRRARPTGVRGACEAQALLHVLSLSVLPTRPLSGFGEQARKRRLLDTGSPAAPRSCTSGASPSPGSAGPASAFRVVFNGGAQCGGRPRPPSWQQRWAAVAGVRPIPLLPAVRIERVGRGALHMCLHGYYHR